MLDSFTSYFDLPPLDPKEIVVMRERHADVWAETAFKFWEPPMF